MQSKQGPDEETKNSSHITFDWDVNVDRINGDDDRLGRLILLFDWMGSRLVLKIDRLFYPCTNAHW